MSKPNPIELLLDDGSVVTIAAVAGLTALGYVRLRKSRRARGSRAMITKYTAREKARSRYTYEPGFENGTILRRLRDGWLISFVDKTGKTRYTVVGGREDSQGRVSATFRAPTKQEVRR